MATAVRNRAHRAASKVPSTLGEDPAPPKRESWEAREAAEAKRLGRTLEAHRHQVGELIGTYYQAFEPKVTGWVRARVNGSSLAPRLSVESLVVETFLRVQKAVLAGAQLDTPLSYLTNTGSMVVLDAIEELNKEQTVPLEVQNPLDSDEDFHRVDVADTRANPEEAVWSAEQSAAYLRALHSFSPRDQRILTRDRREQSAASLAAELGVSVPALKSVALRGTALLSQRVAQELGRRTPEDGRRRLY